MCLGLVDSISALCLGANWKSKITNKKHENVKNIALHRPQEAHLAEGTEKGQQNQTLFNQVETCQATHKTSAACVASNNHTDSTNTDFVVTNKF